MLTVNAIAAADEIMTPVQTECLSAVDMTCLLKTVEEIKVNMKRKPELKYSSIVFTSVRSRTNIAKETNDIVRRRAF